VLYVVVKARAAEKLQLYFLVNTKLKLLPYFIKSKTTLKIS